MILGTVSFTFTIYLLQNSVKSTEQVDFILPARPHPDSDPQNGTHHLQRIRISHRTHPPATRFSIPGCLFTSGRRYITQPLQKFALPIALNKFSMGQTNSVWGTDCG